ncbi:hypothetical protein JNW91_07575 [Micromonospora sp. STR1_7]|uniref:Carrier domain-containing protein n=1 Tax=Micromonospora parastrephiae TaxID=2806101 RepID=A0ABS1XR39_9ACTN|nr:thioesterase domain-containing protein [Micromonospora parastrephiae]MBM0231730.1 hypothetical protein [Micromonospora parastrephiae]
MSGERATTADRGCREIERELCDIWAAVLGVGVQPHDDFFDSGGNSLKVVDVVIAARRRGIFVRSSAVFRNPTPARLAERLTVGGIEAPGPATDSAVPAVLTTSSVTPGSGGRTVAPLVAEGADDPLFLVLSEQFSDVEREAARGWEIGRPVYTVSLEDDPGADAGAAGVPELAGRFLDEIREVQPTGPYHLAGVGTGAVLAFDLARQLRERDQEVARLVLIKPAALPGEPVDFDLAMRRRLASVAARFGLGGGESAQRVLTLLREEGWYGSGTEVADLARLQRVAAGLTWAVSRYRPKRCDVDVVLLQDERDADSAARVWGQVAADCRAHWFDYGLEWFGPLLTDPRVADVMKLELTT